MTPAGGTELLVFAFDAESGRFEGQLAGAMERAESGGTIRVVEGLFVGRDAETGELQTLRVEGGSGALVSAVTDFRLDPARRSRATEQSVDDALRELGDGLGPGASIVAVLVEHVWLRALTEAVGRIGGKVVADERLQAGEPVDVARRALAALQG